jgi:hypothetical protein
LNAILRNLGAGPEDVAGITAVLDTIKPYSGRLKYGQKLRVLVSPAHGALRARLVRIVMLTDTKVEAIVALSDAGKYVSVPLQ